MGVDAQGKPAPFAKLHVLVDSSQETADSDLSNNGTQLARSDVLPVDPAVFEVEPDSVKPGDEVILAGEGLGPEPGRVVLDVAGRELECEITGWYDLGIRWNMPKINVAAATEGEVVVIRGDGAAANPIKITITP
jgi:hypothetical protein